LEDPAGYYFDYHLDYITGTLQLQQEPFGPVYWEGFAMGGPENKYTPWAKLFGETPASGSKDGDPNHYGNFTLDFAVDSITSFEVYPQFGAPYNLTEGVDFIVHPDGVCELLHPLDEYIENEYMGNMSMVFDYGMQGWPGLGGVGNWYAIVASGYGDVWLDFNNGTARSARRLAKEAPPPNEYWYDSWFPYELESWWATGYFPGPHVWPNATDIWVTYYAPAYVVIEYNGLPDPIPRYLEFRGTYEDFLTSMSAPNGTEWDEAYYRSWRDYILVDWVDEGDGMLSYCDYVTFYEFDIDDYRTYHIEAVSTDIGISRKPWICEEDSVKRILLTRTSGGPPS
jgi:hypothetical protein